MICTIHNRGYIKVCTECVLDERNEQWKYDQSQMDQVDEDRKREIAAEEKSYMRGRIDD